MNKYLILAISTMSTIHCMEYVNHEPQNSFTNLTVLDYDGNEHNALHIAQTAKMVHSDTTGKDLTDITTIQEKYAHVNNLIFTTPQPNIYDVVTIYNANILNKKDILYRLAIGVKKYLPLNGEVHAIIQTQKYYPSIYEKAFLTLYPQMYESLSSEIQQQVKPKEHPSIITLQTKYLTDEKAKDEIWSAGYDIIFSKEIEYEIIMNVAEIKKVLKSTILAGTEECGFSEETKKLFSKQYVSLVFDQCKRDNADHVIIPLKGTKIHLRNAGNMRLLLNWSPCFGPKELAYRYAKK